MQLRQPLTRSRENEFNSKKETKTQLEELETF